MLDEPPGLSDVVEFYVQHRLVPADAYGDAAHLAMASLHGLDFLLTWNCRHLANANKVDRIRAVNLLLGISTPIILTPQTFLEML